MIMKMMRMTMMIMMMSIGDCYLVINKIAEVPRKLCFGHICCIHSNVHVFVFQIKLRRVWKQEHLRTWRNWNKWWIFWTRCQKISHFTLFMFLQSFFLQVDWESYILIISALKPVDCSLFTSLGLGGGWGRLENDVKYQILFCRKNSN